MDFRTVTAVLLVYRANFQVMHWLAEGKQFDRIHNLTNGYYDMCLEAADEIAELGMRIGQKPPGYLEAAEILNDFTDHKIIMLSSDTGYKYKDFTEITNIMLNDILSFIEVLLDTPEVKDKSNVGIKSALEGLHDKFDKECRYLNARRSIDD